jgi:hypothetical protein
MKSYDMFDSFLEQFTTAIVERRRRLSREIFNLFFQLCRKYLSTIEHIVKQDPFALKILIRMVTPLPIDQENMLIGSEAAQLFASIVLRILSENLQTVWTTIVDTEWASFRDGLVTLCCIKILYGQETEKEAYDSVNLIAMIPEETRRQETATKLLDLLSDLRRTLPENQEVALYALVGPEHLTLEHLKLAASLETYISYLTQLMISNQVDDKQLDEKIQIQLDKLLKENHFPSTK